MRAKLFAFVKGHDNPEDILPRFHLLQSLTANGKDVSYFEGINDDNGLFEAVMPLHLFIVHCY